MKNLVHLLKVVLHIVLVFFLVNLSIEIWHTSIMIAEINEEIEHVLEEESANGYGLLSFNKPGEAETSILKDYFDRRNLSPVHLLDYIEVFSPPPELI